MSAVLERVNLNLPASARRRLERLAAAAHRPAAAYARELLLAALDHAEREDFRRRVAAARTPALRAREREIIAGLERLRG